MIYKTKIVVTVLLEAKNASVADTICSSLSLEQIGRLIDTGDWIGSTKVGAVTPVPKNKLRRELLALGNDGDFFGELP